MKMKMKKYQLDRQSDLFQNSQVLMDYLSHQRLESSLEMDGVLAMVNVEDESFLDVLDLQFGFLREDLSDPGLVRGIELTSMTVVYRSFIENSLINAIILPAIDEALQDREPPANVREHLTETHPMSKSDVACKISVFVIIVGDLHHGIQFLVHFEQLIRMTEEVVFGQRFTVEHVISETMVRTDGIASHWDHPLHSGQVFVVVQSEQGTHNRSSEGMEDEHQGFGGLVLLQPVVQGLSLLLDLCKVDPYFTFLFCDVGQEAFWVDEQLLAWDAESFELIIHRRETSYADIEIVFLSDLPCQWLRDCLN